MHKMVAVAMMCVLVGCQSAPQTNRNTSLAQIRVQIAMQYIAQHQFDIAKRQLDMALVADDKYAPAYRMMGVLLLTEGSAKNQALAQKYFVEAIRLDDADIYAKHSYGVYLLKMGRHTQAIEYLNAAANALGYEYRLASLEDLAMALYHVGDFAKAHQALNKRQLSSQLSLEGQQLLMAVYWQMRQTKQAKMMFDELSKALPEQAWSDIAKQVVDDIKNGQDDTL